MVEFRLDSCPRSGAKLTFQAQVVFSVCDPYLVSPVT